MNKRKKVRKGDNFVKNLRFYDINFILTIYGNSVRLLIIY